MTGVVGFGFLKVDQSSKIENNEDKKEDAPWISALKKMECGGEEIKYYYSATGWNFNPVSEKDTKAKQIVYVYNGEQGDGIQRSMFPCEVSIYDTKNIKEGVVPSKDNPCNKVESIENMDCFLSNLKDYYSGDIELEV